MNADDTLRAVSYTLGHVKRTEITAFQAHLGWLRAHHSRLFIIGNGGGAGFATHAASDFRKIAGIDAYACDNVPELTARINDDGWGFALADWLRFATQGDGLLVFSVGGGEVDGTSENLINACEAAKVKQMRVLGVVGGDGGQVARLADASIVIPSSVTPVVEACQAAVWHAVVEALR